MIDWERVAAAHAADPFRVLASACVLGRPTGWQGQAWPTDAVLALGRLSNVRIVGFCPEDVVLGTPRPLTTLHDGNGEDVLDGRATVRTEGGEDVTDRLVAGARAMLARALDARVELAVLLDMSDSCGTHVVYDREPGRYQRGPGVASALLQRHGVPVVAQRDARTLDRLLAALDPGHRADPEARDFVEGEWYVGAFGPAGGR